MKFQDRLEKYRKNHDLKKRELASKLEISESYYNLLASGKREPSKNVLYRLVLLTNQPEEYWVYGITSDKEYLEKREKFKCLLSASEFLIETKELNEETVNKIFSNIESECNEVEKLLIKGLRADLLHQIKKSKK